MSVPRCCTGDDPSCEVCGIPASSRRQNAFCRRWQERDDGCRGGRCDYASSDDGEYDRAYAANAAREAARGRI